MTVAENIICWFAMSAPYQKEFLPGERKESRLQNPIIFEYLLYWLLILLGLVPFVAGAYVYLRYQPPVYAVSSELLLWLWQIRSLWQVWLWQEVWVWIREEVVFLPTKVVPPPYLLPTSSLCIDREEVGRR